MFLYILVYYAREVGDSQVLPKSKRSFMVVAIARAHLLIGRFKDVENSKICTILPPSKANILSLNGIAPSSGGSSGVSGKNNTLKNNENMQIYIVFLNIHYKKLIHNYLNYLMSPPQKKVLCDIKPFFRIYYVPFLSNNKSS